MSGAALMITRCATVLPPEPRWARDGTRTSPPGWFDYKTELGPRGYKYLPPALHYLLTAARHALADGVGAAGVVLGTNSAVSALHAAMDRTVVQSHSAELSPMLAPYFSVNLAAGKLASEHRLTGFQLTLTSPRIAGLEAIQVAARALAMGRASCLLIAATEAAPDPAEPGADRGEEGAVVLVARPLSNVDASGAGVRSTAGSAGSSAALSGGGTCRARTFFVPPDAPHRAGEALAAAWAGLGLWDGGSAGGTSKWLRDGGSAGGISKWLPPDGGPRIVAVLDDSPVARRIAAALDGRARVIPAAAGCLEPLVQVAAALRAEREATVVLSASAEGNVATALVTPPGAV